MLAARYGPSQATMSIQRIAAIKDGTYGAPLEGDAIEALGVAAAKNTQHLIDLPLRVIECYSVKRSICTKKQYTMWTVDHKVSIILAKYTQAITIWKDNRRAVACPLLQRSPNRLNRMS